MIQLGLYTDKGPGEAESSEFIPYFRLEENCEHSTNEVSVHILFVNNVKVLASVGEV